MPEETQWNEAAMRTGKTAVRKEGSPSKGHDRLAIATFGEACAEERMLLLKSGVTCAGQLMTNTALPAKRSIYRER
ncbi:hypothetical protein [Reichenbachiella sp. MALMAid0571]|uniref:hypothetical protein n=1 Tax=Reichenbachiella sp. MALMAid0571 TaxID=3143939 RepID=UPI0032DFC12B